MNQNGQWEVLIENGFAQSVRMLRSFAQISRIDTFTTLIVLCSFRRHDGLVDFESKPKSNAWNSPHRVNEIDFFQ